MTAAVHLDGVRKSFGTVDAVRDVGFDIEEGEIFALLGPNGAGKTTLLEIIEGFQQRDAGDVSVLGTDPGHATRALRERLGIVLQECAMPPYLNVLEVLSMTAGYYPRSRDVDEIIELVGLGEKRTSRVKTLSGGQRRRLDLALALIGDPDLVVLDEPTTGFDPSARRQSWDLVRGMRTLGKTVLMTTHYMDEAQALADRIAVIARGELVELGDASTIGGRDTGRVQIRFGLPPGIDASALPVAASAIDGALMIETDRPTAVLALVTGWAAEAGFELLGLTVTRPTLEDVYLELTAP